MGNTAVDNKCDCERVPVLKKNVESLWKIRSWKKEKKMTWNIFFSQKLAFSKN